MLEALSKPIIDIKQEDTRKYKSGRTKTTTAALQISAAHILFYFIFAKLVGLFGAGEGLGDKALDALKNLFDPGELTNPLSLGDWLNEKRWEKGLTAAGRRTLVEQGWVEEGDMGIALTIAGKREVLKAQIKAKMNEQMTIIGRVQRGEITREEAIPLVRALQTQINTLLRTLESMR